MAEQPPHGHVAPPPSSPKRAHLQAAGNLVAPTDLAARTAAVHADLVQELRPQSTLEQILVANLGRHAAGLELGAAAEAAALKFAATNQSAANLFDTTDEEIRPHLAAFGNQLVERITKYRSQHERGLHASLRDLLQLSRIQKLPFPVDLFRDEEACFVYLTQWQREQPWHCPNCGGSQRCFLRKRPRWECDCGRQFSIRAGTIFANSHIPLIGWFRLVLTLLHNPNIKTADLVNDINIVRRDTLRKMSSRVAEALASPLAEQLLGGLPSFVLTRLRQVYLFAALPAPTFTSPEPSIAAAFEDASTGVTSISDAQTELPNRPPAPA